VVDVVGTHFTQKASSRLPDSKIDETLGALATKKQLTLRTSTFIGLCATVALRLITHEVPVNLSPYLCSITLMTRLNSVKLVLPPAHITLRYYGHT
jgi:hypothetical protein